MGIARVRLLLVNPNTSDVHTRSIFEEARKAAAGGVQVDAVTASYGARYIDTRSEAAIAAHATFTAVAEHPEYDGAIIAAFVDPGLEATREAMRYPVVGILEAAALTACMLGGRFGVVAAGPRVLPIFEERIAAYGLSARLAGVASTADFGASVAEQPEAVSELARCARLLVSERRADVILLGGAPLACLREAIQKLVPVPVLDGVSCAVKQVQALIEIGCPKPTEGSYQAPGPRAVMNLPSPLKNLFT